MKHKWLLGLCVALLPVSLVQAFTFEDINYTVTELNADGMEVQTAPDNRVDVAVIGDGFSLDNGDMENFKDVTSKLIKELSTYKPISFHKNLFNFHRFDVISENSLFEKIRTVASTNQTFTPFGSRPCEDDLTASSQPLCVNNQRISAFLKNHYSNDSTKYDIIILLSNAYDEKINKIFIGANAGIEPGVPIVRMPAFSQNLINGNKLPSRRLPHEFGHALGKLADEYTQGITGCGNADLSINLTGEVDREKIPWKHHIFDETPIPTPTDYLSTKREEINADSSLTASQRTYLLERYSDTNFVGLFEGGGYCKNGIYRPTLKSTMNQLDDADGYGPVNEEQIEREIFRLVSVIENPTAAEKIVRINSVETNSKVFSITHNQLPENVAYEGSFWTLDNDPTRYRLNDSYTLEVAELSTGVHNLSPMESLRERAFNLPLMKG